MTATETERPESSRVEFLRDFWYPVLPGAEVRRGQMRRQVLMNMPLLVCRDSRGEAFVIDDHCPHRGIPLSCGSFDGKLVECCYHGWLFDREGRCRHIPALLPNSPVRVERIRARTFQSAELDGFIWAFIPGEHSRRPDKPELPRLPVFSDRYKSCVISRKLECDIDHGIVGLMDPAHGPFVHQAWWWRSRRSIHEKAKRFEPTPLGFRMSAHTPSKNSAAYKLLGVYGSEYTTTIDFVLPNVRYEQIRCGKYWFSSRTVVTPVTDQECRLDFIAAWNLFRFVPFILPVFRHFANQFIGQDQRVMEKQSAGLRDNPTLMLIDDSDTQAKWYYKLKAACQESQRSGEALDHPLKAPVTLQWRS